MNEVTNVRGAKPRRLIALAILAALGASSASAAEPSQSDLIKQLQTALEQSKRTTDLLLRRVEQLETNAKAQPAAAPVASTNQQGEIAQIKEQLSQIATGMGARSQSEGLPLHGFMDVGYASSNRDYPKGFNISKLDFYLTPQFSDRVKGLAELNFEVGSDGHVATDLERLQLGYTVSDSLTLWMGRFHTPYGYWNTAYHHGAQIQTSITRPTFLEFEDGGGILPAHTVGLWGTGSTKTGSGKLSYDLYVANAPRMVYEGSPLATLDPNLASTTNGKYIFGGNLGYAFGGSLDGLKLGLHAYRGDISDDAAVTSKHRAQMFGGYAVYLADDWEVLSEYYRMSNRNLSLAGDSSHKSWAAYGQVGRTFGQITPYARIERSSLDQSDTYFASLQSGQSYRAGIVGVRYDLDPKSAVKFEFDRKSLLDRAKDNVSELWVQYSVRF